jgi:PAS domain S-box-containing protein
LEGSWKTFLDHLEEAVIVMDDQRVLQHVNDAARRLLGYERGQSVGSRCRLTTRGVDCENACPLTFALEAGLDKVEDFSTMYRAADGRAVQLQVTVIPLTDGDGSFQGAVEILRPSDPDPGFFMSGTSAAAHAMRQRALELARERVPVRLVGEAPVCRDVAAALHRFSGLSQDLFRDWGGTWDGIRPWPPGSVYAYGEAASSLLQAKAPDGWRLIVGASGGEPQTPEFELFELPAVQDLDGDLEHIISRWVTNMVPTANVTPDAVSELARVVRDRGWRELEAMICRIASRAEDVVDADDLPSGTGPRILVDDLLEAADPMAALEERLLREVLDRCEWRMQEAADMIGISRVTLWRKMKDYSITRP